MKLTRRNIAGTAAAAALVLGGALAPSAATASSSTTADEAAAARVVTSASGTLVCPAGQRLWVRVTLQSRARVLFQLEGRVNYDSPAALNHINNYGVSGGAWRVDSSGGITEVSDYCTGAVR